MLKRSLNAYLKRKEEYINRIIAEQEQKIAEYAAVNHFVQLYDKIVVDGAVVVVVGFATKSKAFTLYVEYKRIRADGNMDNVTFDAKLKTYKNLGKYNGKL